MTLLELIGEQYLILRVVLLGVAITTIAFGIYVYAKNPRNLPNRMFAAFAGSIALWTVGVIFARTPISPPILDRLMFVGGTLTTVFLLTLFKSVQDGVKFRVQWVFGLFVALGLIMALVSFTPLVYREAIIDGGKHRGFYGSLYPGFAAYVLSCFAIGVATLWRGIRLATGLARLQLQYLLLGVTVPGVAVLITNVIFPLFFGTQVLAGYGPLFTIPMIIVVAHAIVRHRLMDIRVIIRQGTVYALTGVILALPAVTLVISVHLWIPEAGWRVVLDALVVGTVALLAAPLRNGLDRVLNTYLYRERYNYYEIIRSETRKQARLQPPEALGDDLCAAVDRVIRPEVVALWLETPETPGYRRVVQRGVSVTMPDVIPATSVLVSWLALHPQLLLRDDPAQADPGWRAAVGKLADLKAELAVPISAGHGLDGILLIGPKRSGDPYFDEDLTLLSALAAEAAVALSNGHLHQEVVHAREQIEAILQTMPSAVVAVDRLGQVEWFNDAAQRLTRLSVDSIRGRRLPGSHPLCRLIAATLADGQPRQEEVELEEEGPGPRVQLVCSTAPFISPEGEVRGAVCVGSDLSRVKELEAETRRVERLATFGAMASGIAHEVRNPLVAIKTHLQLLPEECTCAAQEDQRQFTAVATREIDRIDALLERLIEMRDFPRASFVRVDLREMLVDTLLLLQDRLTQESVTVVQELQSGCWIRGDQEQLKQLFLNLVMNAGEAVSGCGQIRIRCWARRDRPRATVVVEISDTGPGIPDTVQETLFEPFVTTKAHGTGLGLAICRAVVDVHRAKIRATNHSQGTGATITVEFPGEE